MKKNICMIGPNINLNGGIATVIKQYMNSDIRNKYNLIAVSSYGNRRIKEFIKGIYKYKKFLSEGKVDLVHIHTASRGSFYRKSLFIDITPKNIPIVLHIHGGGFIEFYDKSPFFIQTRIKKIMKRAFKIVVLSKNFKMDLINRFNLEKDKICIIYNGININEKHIDFHNKKLQILYMGKLNESKGIYDLLKIIPNIYSKYPKVKFIIAGNGEIDRVKHIVRVTNIEKCTHIVGWIDGKIKDKYLHESSILVMPSHFEAFGISIIEAMKCGLAIVANEVGGIPDIINHDVNGKLVQSGNLKQLEEALGEYIKNEKLTKKIGLMNSEMVKKFDITNSIRQIQEIYEELLTEESYL
ncbi:glycosyltransferase family 4 protein [Clostridium sporogenes]|uniref:glycosyltransferase family 4 protein n=1 Tax=Clostridium sporogenes TaxID=1509 RepID=UPI000774024A|nr:glycosyltransferase family 4 protein [Clostridium sporogenes]MDS1006766.1 glycosyltransferase family 4 protein [Clostridium sporogenes]NFD95897.1 glycosyltransferase family 4 protein [Clostridium sporogenes]NFE45049.1 glycosyltransferase family 4 protein [Clostridium sporogenes]NFF18029.1 glycosyltransferase family 4 protein [Clostridium sporogenes]NFF73524.1 glycosyltransferase family 4 protein [Clostridium sporogenes]